MKKNLAKITKPGQGTWKSIFQFASFLFTKPGFDLFKKIARKTLHKSGLLKEHRIAYQDWIKAASGPTLLRKEYEENIGVFKVNPEISIVLSISDPDTKFLPFAVDSIIAQNYPYWQLLIVNNISTQAIVDDLLQKYTANDNRIKLIDRNESETLANNYNSLATSASGDFLLFMDQDDLLASNCIFEFARHINVYPEDKIIYADEDKIDASGLLSDPSFKPGWGPDHLLSGNYVGNDVIIEKDLFIKAGGFNDELRNVYVYDLLLRTSELTNKIGHISRVLYHKRKSKSFLTDTDVLTGKVALASAMVRRNTPATVESLNGLPGNYHVKYNVTSFEKVSIIIPTKDQATLLKVAIDSILQKTDYPNYEIIVLNNNSITEEFFSLMETYKAGHSDLFRCIDAHFPFNYAKLMNLGASESAGAYLLMLNNDVTVIHNDWMTQLVSYAQRDRVGAVGAKLLYPDDTIQHAGIVLGATANTGHIFAHLPKDYRDAQITRNYSAVTGACMMCRKELYNKVGGMDETLEVEYNDFDLCLKFLQLGYYNVYLPSVELYHFESATRGHPFRSTKSFRQHEKDFAIFKRKWQKIIDNDPYYNINLNIAFRPGQFQDR